MYLQSQICLHWRHRQGQISFSTDSFLDRIHIIFLTKDHGGVRGLAARMPESLENISFPITNFIWFFELDIISKTNENIWREIEIYRRLASENVII